MGKKVVFSMVIALFAVFVMMPQEALANGVGVRIDGAPVHFEGQGAAIVDGRTLVPVRGVFERLGFDVGWDGALRQVTLARSDFNVILNVDSDVFTTNGASHTLDVPAQIIGNSTMLPIRAVLESVGYSLDWDGGAQMVLISQAPATQTPVTLPAPIEPIDAPPQAAGPAYITIRGRQLSTALTELNFIDMGITDLTNAEIVPLRYMTNLTGLQFGFNRQISDITPLAGLTNLTWLCLCESQVRDFSPLAGLKNLDWLQINTHLSGDLRPFAGLTELTWLAFGSDIPLSDLTPLSGLTNLEFLVVNSGTADLTPLVGLTNLETLRLIGTPRNLAPLANMTNLRSLSIDYTPGTDLRPLAGLTNLRSFSSYGFQPSDLTFLSGLTNLENLVLNHECWESYGPIRDLTPLARLVNLRYLQLRRQQITDLRPLAGMRSLRFLDLQGNPITDWSPVSHIREVSGRP